MPIRATDLEYDRSDNFEEVSAESHCRSYIDFPVSGDDLLEVYISQVDRELVDRIVNDAYPNLIVKFYDDVFIYTSKVLDIEDGIISLSMFTVRYGILSDVVGIPCISRSTAVKMSIDIFIKWAACCSDAIAAGYMPPL